MSLGRPRRTLAHAARLLAGPCFGKARRHSHCRRPPGRVHALARTVIAPTGAAQFHSSGTPNRSVSIQPRYRHRLCSPGRTARDAFRLYHSFFERLLAV
jgi:hypothetical protein